VKKPPKRTKRQLTSTTPQERKAQKSAARAWKGIVDATLSPEVTMKKQYDFKGAKRGRFAKKSPTLEGRGVQTWHPRVINVSFYVSQEVAAALRALRGTGLYGNGVDCASVAEELLRHALLDPKVLAYWQKPRDRNNSTGPFRCRTCGFPHATWAPRCTRCHSLEGFFIGASAKKLHVKKPKRRSP